LVPRRQGRRREQATVFEPLEGEPRSVLRPPVSVPVAEGSQALGAEQLAEPGTDGHGNSPPREGWPAIQWEDSEPGAQTGRPGAAGSVRGVAWRRCLTDRFSRRGAGPHTQRCPRPPARSALASATYSSENGPRGLSRFSIFFTPATGVGPWPNTQAMS